LAIGGGRGALTLVTLSDPDNDMLSANDALKRLREGNLRFASNAPAAPALRLTRRDELSRQEPFAIVLGCSDARVPAEIIFDQGLGDLFVIRVAGNIVAPSGVGSVEFAAGRFGTRLVVVLGHSGCGAVAATIEELQGVPQDHSQNLRSIVNRVRPSVENLLDVSRTWNPDELLHQAVRANIRMSANQLRHGSQLLEQLIQDDGLMVVGAEYSLETGVVEFLESPGDAIHSAQADARRRS
jgi:carbonic anhydrase